MDFLKKVPGHTNNFINHLKYLVNKHLDHYIKRKRKIDSLLFFKLLLKYSFSEETYSSIVSNYSIDEFKENNKLVSLSKEAFRRFRQKIPSEAVYKIFKELKEYTKNYFIDKLKDVSKSSINVPEHNLVSCDGSEIFIDHSFQDLGYTTNTNKFISVGKLSILYNNSYEIIEDIVLSKDKNERTLLTNQLEILKDQSILVMDRGYFSLNLLETINNNPKQIYSVFRLKGDIYKTYPKELDGSKLDYYYNLKLHSNTYLKVRIVKYTLVNPINKKKETYRLLTTLLDRKKYQLKTLKDIYFSRWAIEENIKTLKTKIDITSIVSKTENLIKQEVFMSGIISLLNKIIEFDTLIDFEIKKKSLEINPKKNKTISLSNLKLSEINKKFKVETSTCIRILKNNIDFLFNNPSKFMEFYNVIKINLEKTISLKRPGRHFEHKTKGPRMRKYKKAK